jgi:hypothetical protein
VRLGKGRGYGVNGPVLSATAVRRVLRDFVAGQCGALAVDLGDDSRHGMLQAERLCSHFREGAAILNSKRRVGVKRARVVALCALIAMDDDLTSRSLLVMRLRSRRAHETPPHRVLEQFLLAER